MKNYELSSLINVANKWSSANTAKLCGMEELELELRLDAANIIDGILDKLVLHPSLFSESSVDLNPPLFLQIFSNELCCYWRKQVKELLFDIYIFVDPACPLYCESPYSVDAYRLMQSLN